MDDLTPATFMALLGNQFILPFSLIVGVFAIVSRCFWPKGRQIITPIAGVLLISSSILLRTELVMFLVALNILAWFVIVTEFVTATFVALAFICGQTQWPKATKLFFRPLSIILVLLVGFQFTTRLVGALVNWTNYKMCFDTHFLLDWIPAFDQAKWTIFHKTLIPLVYGALLVRKKLHVRF